MEISVDDKKMLMKIINLWDRTLSVESEKKSSAEIIRNYFL
jgi:hypothetical protein